MVDELEFRERLDVPKDAVLSLYRAADWSSANKMILGKAKRNP